MDDFATWFCLKNRQNFTIDPQVNSQDSQYYFGRDDIRERLQKQIRKSFIAPGVPKVMVHGPYGSGKTQTLFYLEHFLKTQTPNSVKGIPHTLYLTIELRSNSTAANFHMQLIEALGKDVVAKWIRTLFDSTSDFDKTLLDIADDQNIYLALKELRSFDEKSFMAWRWLTGQALKSTELNSLQVTRNLGDVGSSDLVNALVAIGFLASKVNEKLIFLIDEAEQLQNVRAGDANESIHDYLRKLSEPANSSVGYLIGFKADVLDDAPETLRRPDISGRIGKSNYIDLPNLQAVADVKVFMRELLKNLTDETLVNTTIDLNKLNSESGIFPFERNAFELLADYSSQDQSRSLPRYLITAINECAIQAWDDQKHLIDETIVNQVAPFVFQ